MIKAEDIQAILNLNDIYFAIIQEWDLEIEDNYYQYLYNEMNTLTPEVKKELRALEVNFNQLPEYSILLERIGEIRKLFERTHKHQFIYHHVNSLKKYIERAVKAKNIKGQLKPKMTASLFALCLFYLQESKFISGSLEKKYEKTIKLLDFEVAPFKFTTIKKEYYNIGKGENDPMNLNNLIDLLEWLKDFPEAIKKVRKELQSFD